MTAATNSTLGEISLNGDFFNPSGSAPAPQLSITGVNPGEYKVAQKIIVDEKGRIIWIKQLSEDVSLQKSAFDVKGVIKLGYPFEAPSGILTMPRASEGVSGVIKLGSGLSKDTISGATNADIIANNASSTAYGIVKLSTGILLNSDVIDIDTSLLSFPDATDTTSGVASISTGLKIDAGVTSVDGDHLISVADIASTTVLGKIKAGNYISNDSGVISKFIGLPGGISFDGQSTNPYYDFYFLPKIGSGFVNISTSNNPTISIPKATSTTLGTVKINQNQFENISGVLNFNMTSNSVLGYINGVSGADLTISNNFINSTKVFTPGTYHTASDTVLGKVKIDTGTLKIDGTQGKISLYNLIERFFDSKTYGGVLIDTQIPSGLKIIDGTLSVDTNNLFNNNPYRKFPKIGNNIDVVGGVISLSTASPSKLGLVKYSSLFNFTSNQLSIPIASASVAGGIKIGSRFSISNNMLSVNDSSSTDKGVVQVGAGLSVTDGVVSIPFASKTEFGLIKSVDTGTLSFTYGNLKGTLSASSELPEFAYAGTSGAVYAIEQNSGWPPEHFTSRGIHTMENSLNTMFDIYLIGGVVWQWYAVETVYGADKRIAYYRMGWRILSNYKPILNQVMKLNPDNVSHNSSIQHPVRRYEFLKNINLGGTGAGNYLSSVPEKSPDGHSIDINLYKKHNFINITHYSVGINTNYPKFRFRPFDKPQFGTYYLYIYSSEGGTLQWPKKGFLNSYPAFGSYPAFNIRYNFTNAYSHDTTGNKVDIIKVVHHIQPPITGDAWPNEHNSPSASYNQSQSFTITYLGTIDQ